MQEFGEKFLLVGLTSPRKENGGIDDVHFCLGMLYAQLSKAMTEARQAILFPVFFGLVQFTAGDSCSKFFQELAWMRDAKAAETGVAAWME